MRSRLANDAISIWKAGIAAVQPETLFKEAIHLDRQWLSIETDRGELFEADLNQYERMFVIGGGKAGAAMGHALLNRFAGHPFKKKLAGGLISIPAGTELPNNAALSDPSLAKKIRYLAGRPASVNEPRPEGVIASQKILKIAQQATSRDLVVCLISGGASALLPLPAPPITLAQKTVIARRLSERGATIEQLNTIRQHLSLLKGGGLARACNAGQLLTLLISDVPGDSLDLIGSGPTVLPSRGPQEAVNLLEELGLAEDAQLQPVAKFLRNKVKAGWSPTALDEQRCQTLLLANNATAVDAAGIQAEKLGYSHAMSCSCQPEGEAEALGRELAQTALRMRKDTNPSSPDCLITGGEPTVTLAPAAERGLGGRNQQLALAALEEVGNCQGIAILSGGTDGEDGPTDAAGAWIDESIALQTASRASDLKDSLRLNDAYRFFEPLDCLLKTGPTHTNVCDLRVVTIDRSAQKKTP